MFKAVKVVGSSSVEEEAKTKGFEEGTNSV